jgi:hypothetical protein
VGYALRKREVRLLQDLVLSVLERAVEELESEIRLLAAGQRAISDVRDGRIVDVSQETLLQKRVYRDRLSKLIEKLEGVDAKRT